ncbi:MAG: hypothetical protein RXR31_02700 [Thermoproteota archaeon]
MNSKDAVLALIVLALGGAGIYAVYKYTEAQQSQQQQSGTSSSGGSGGTGGTGGSVSGASPYYTLTFTESGLPKGKTWIVNVNGVDYYGVAPSPIVITNLTGVSDWQVPTLYGGENVFGWYTWKYTPTPSQGTANSTETIPITYSGSYNL